MQPDFLKSQNSNSRDWYLTDWLSAVRIASGSRGLTYFFSAFAILLSPSLFLLIYSLSSSRPIFLIPVVLSLWGFWTSSTGPSGVGVFANLIVAIVGLSLSITLKDWRPGFAALLPGLTWFGSCAILGPTASYLMEALRASELTFQNLVSRGILKDSADSLDGQPVQRATDSD